MKHTLTIILFVSALLCSLTGSAQAETSVINKITVSTTDLEILIGEWTGSLTYIDYSSNKPYTMPAELKVEQGKKDRQLVLFTSYPNEPHANDKGQIKLSKTGLKINKEEIVSKEMLSEDVLQIVTEYRGKDNKKKALIRNIYELSHDRFIITKDVQFEDSKDWIKRNEYDYRR